MKIVIVSNSPWRNDNSFGNSFSNIFDGIEEVEIVNIYCKFGQPNNGFVKRYFQITEASLLKNLKDCRIPSGREIFPDMKYDSESLPVITTVQFYRKHKWQLLIWARALIWKVGRWKSPELIRFLDDFQPDLLFIPVYYSHYLHDINRFILRRYQIPAVGYVSDDVYTMRQFSLSPLYWIDRLLMRRTIAWIFRACKTVYTISEFQRQEYAAIFGDKFRILTKCGDFSDANRPPQKKPSLPLRLLYTGNLGSGRADTLALLAKVVAMLNQDGTVVQLDIYSASPLKKKQRASLEIPGACSLHEAVSFAEVIRLQQEADVLVHAESFRWRDRLLVHQSFSTKIVDYLSRYRCILAIGKEDCASIAYFLHNNAGVVAQTPSSILLVLNDLLGDSEKLTEYAQNAWSAGQTYHSRADMQKQLLATLRDACK